jgi:hypothetical protein
MGKPVKQPRKKHDTNILTRLDEAVKAPYGHPAVDGLLRDARDFILLLEREIAALRSALYDPRPKVVNAETPQGPTVIETSRP